MFRGWEAAVELRRGAECKLEVSAMGLNVARRGGYKDRLMLIEYQTQSRDLQAEMREDVVRLQKRLADSESQAVGLTADLAAGKAQIAASKVRAEQERLQSEERLAEVTRRINTLRVKEAELKDVLGRSHAEETRVCVEVLASLTEVCRLRTKNELEAVTVAVATELLANKDYTDRLQKELADARATNGELRRVLQGSVAK
jgi:SMC interacting uncharacterized protein involved in chromosome segregation